MKLIHCADIHIGSPIKNLPLEKSKIRKREITDTFFRMIDFANQNNIQIIIIAGDLFDGDTVLKSTVNEVMQKIASYPEIKFLYLLGNHDNKVVLKEKLKNSPQNLFFFDNLNDWKYYSFDNICIAGIDALSQNEQEFYDKLKLNEDKFNIVVLHSSVKELSLDKLKAKNIDYLALGDIHIPDILPTKLDFRGVYAYSGCLDGRGFDEIGNRGFFVLEVQNGRCKREFFSLSKRSYEVVEVDITNLDNHFEIYSKLKEKTAHIEKENILKVVLIGKRKVDTQIERQNLEAKMQDNFFYCKVIDQSVLDIQNMDLGNEISLKSQLVKLVNESDLQPQMKDKVLEYAIKALNGEVIDL